MKFIKKIIAQLLLWIWGWKIVLEGPASNLERCVLVVAPHTANEEYILGNLAYWVLGKKLKVRSGRNSLHFLSQEKIILILVILQGHVDLEITPKQAY